MSEHLHFVTGRLAEPALRDIVQPLAREAGFDYSIDVLHITVAALMTTQWIAPRIKPPAQTSRIIIPGYCRGELEPLQQLLGVEVQRGPKDLRELPQFFGRGIAEDYGAWDIEILAEINHAPQFTVAEVLQQAEALVRDGADLIDLGCNPGELWTEVGDYVRALRDAGHRVSIDSFDPREIALAAAAGAELVLSVNSTNRDFAADWGCEVVVVPDVPATMEGLDATIDHLSARGVRFRLDPILEPIGFGFAASLERYAAARRRWPEAEMMMGIGNLTELTDVDSAGVNVLLLGYCQELRIRSVLTTQVINWARSSVLECDLGRRLMHYAVEKRRLPKHIEPRLVLLRDPRPLWPQTQDLQRLAATIKDPNYRVFVADDGLHLIAAGLHLCADDPYELFDQLLQRQPKNLDASHAFYLGYELCKALTARTLHKQYRQDEALDWGFLTRPEESHHERRRREPGTGKG